MVFLLLLSCNIIALNYIDVFFNVIPFLIEFKAICKTYEKDLKSHAIGISGEGKSPKYFWFGNEWNL